jgi:hypothetical protein
MSARSKTPRRTPDTPERRPRDTTPSAEDLYQREKARRGRVPTRDSELIAAAKKEYLALLAQEAVKGKGGRPKKKPESAGRAAPDADTEMGDEAADLDQE